MCITAYRVAEDDARFSAEERLMIMVCSAITQMLSGILRMAGCWRRMMRRNIA